MSEKNKNNGLSPEDADLWKRVTKTLDKSNQVKTKTQSSKSEPENNISGNAVAINNASDDWHKYIGQTPDKSPREKTTSVPGHAPQSRANQKPKTEDFAALLDSYDQGTPLKDSADQSSEQQRKPGSEISPKPNLPIKPAVETFNQRDARNISSGKQTIDGAIDLHGLTQREAETALKNFLLRAQQDDKRTVLVITGKGRKKDYEDRPFELGAPKPGVLRRSVPLWLDAMPDIILSYTTSHIKHGGTGALYVRLRKLTK